jgi:hypothetical protein
MSESKRNIDPGSLIGNTKKAPIPPERHRGFRSTEWTWADLNGQAVALPQRAEFPQTGPTPDGTLKHRPAQSTDAERAGAGGGAPPHRPHGRLHPPSRPPASAVNDPYSALRGVVTPVGRLHAWRSERIPQQPERDFMRESVRIRPECIRWSRRLEGWRVRIRSLQYSTASSG